MFTKAKKDMTSEEHAEWMRQEEESMGKMVALTCKAGGAFVVIAILLSLYAYVVVPLFNAPHW